MAEDRNGQEVPGIGEARDAQGEKIRLGGMALRNGLLIHGPTHWAAAVRDEQGRMQVTSAPKPKLAPAGVAKLPGLRGPIRLGEAMLVVPLARLRLRAMRLPFEDPRVVVAIAASFLLSRFARKAISGGARRELTIQLAGLLPAVSALFDRRLTAYHGSEHKVIGAYEQGLTDATPVPKEHIRCGSNLIAPMMVLTVAGTVVLEKIVESPSPAARGLTSLAGASLAVEMFAWSERNREHPVAKAFHAQGREIQRHLATSEPSPEQLAVGMAALEEILRVEAAGPS